jgi:hypothetical protein
VTLPKVAQVGYGRSRLRTWCPGLSPQLRETILALSLSLCRHGPLVDKVTASRFTDRGSRSIPYRTVADQFYSKPTLWDTEVVPGVIW